MVRRIITRTRRATTSWLVLVTFCAAPALAQEAPASNDKSSWVLGYALVLLGIVLGLVAICRPGNRSAEVRRDDE